MACTVVGQISALSADGGLGLLQWLLSLDYKEYSCRLAQFSWNTLLAGETLALNGKVLRGS